MNLEERSPRDANDRCNFILIPFPQPGISSREREGLSRKSAKLRRTIDRSVASIKRCRASSIGRVMLGTRRYNLIAPRDEANKKYVRRVFEAAVMAPRCDMIDLHR